MNINIDHSETGYDSQATEATRRRYQRNARSYDLMEGGSENRHRLWRQQLWFMTNGPKVLEVGVGTEKTFPTIQMAR